MEFIKRLFCKHGEMEIVEDNTFITSIFADVMLEEVRKYLVCKKCGYKRKISNK